MGCQEAPGPSASGVYRGVLTGGEEAVSIQVELWEVGGVVSGEITGLSPFVVERAAIRGRFDDPDLLLLVEHDGFDSGVRFLGRVSGSGAEIKGRFEGAGTSSPVMLSRTGP